MAGEVDTYSFVYNKHSHVSVNHNWKPV